MSRMALVIAQLTDIHVCAARPENEARLAETVELLQTFQPKPDVLVLTGDLVDTGTAVEYETLLHHLGKLDIPLVPLPGNHDERGQFRRTFQSARPELAAFEQSTTTESGDAPFHYVVDDFPVRLVCLDSVIPFRTEGTFSEQSAQWLDTALAEQPTKPTVVAIHHPPFETGIWWMDVLGLDEYGRFRSVIERHAQVQLILSGHHHRPISSKIAGTTVWVSPSTANQHGADLDISATPSLTTEPSAFSIHIWKNETFVSHTIPVNISYTRLEDLGPGYPEFVASLRERFTNDTH